MVCLQCWWWDFDCWHQYTSVSYHLRAIIVVYSCHMVSPFSRFWRPKAAVFSYKIGWSTIEIWKSTQREPGWVVKLCDQLGQLQEDMPGSWPSSPSSWLGLAGVQVNQEEIYIDLWVCNPGWWFGTCFFPLEESSQLTLFFLRGRFHQPDVITGFCSEMCFFRPSCMDGYRPLCLEVPGLIASIWSRFDWRLEWGAK